MSVKHVKEYYNKICEDYHDMLETLREMEEEASKNIVPPEVIENLKNLVKPMKDNYERWSYMVYLLNMPNKKEKIRKYEKQFENIERKLRENNDLTALHKENEEAIEEVKKSFSLILYIYMKQINYCTNINK